MNLGLIDTTIEKFMYPWSLCKDYDWGYHPTKDKVIYDYFTVSKKINK